MLSIIQIVLGVAIIILILLQERGGGMGGLFGGTSGDASFYQARRGISRIIFITTVVLVVAFAGLALLRLAL